MNEIIIDEPPFENEVVESLNPEQPVIPKIVFIIPYRNREAHLEQFSKHMAYILEDIPQEDYEMFVINQNDDRGFNRGAIKNIGFLYVKNKYPTAYTNITLVFNDVDTMPKHKNYACYNTIRGVIKHFCGFTYTLGGIVCITGHDFEKINGYPNYWSWGYEDNALYDRAVKYNIYIDRSVFCNFVSDINKTGFISLHSGVNRTVNKSEYKRYIQRVNEGIQTISNVYYTSDSDGTSTKNKNSVFMNMVNVSYFTVGHVENESYRSEYDLRNGPLPFGKILNRRNGTLPRINMII